MADVVGELAESCQVDLDDLVDRWHAGEWSDLSLEQVICNATGWTHDEFGRWVSHGRPSE